MGRVSILFPLKVKMVNGKVHPITDHESPEVE
jgi:hypothetical protein